LLTVAVVVALSGITAVQAGSSHGKPPATPTTVYDTTLNVTWLANADLAKSQTFGVPGIDRDGSMQEPTAAAWIAAAPSVRGPCRGEPA
jgi:hypothetical protein